MTKRQDGDRTVLKKRLVIFGHKFVISNISDFSQESSKEWGHLNKRTCPKILCIFCQVSGWSVPYNPTKSICSQKTIDMLCVQF